MAKITISLSLIILCAISVNADIDDNEIEEIYMYGGVRIYQMERQCAMLGGLCANKSDCLLNTSNDGLCPLNQHRGVECCYELKRNDSKPLPCKQHAGECMNSCHPRIQRPSTDCVDGTVCCILLR